MDELLHYGVARRSGRYPWGSGQDPQRSKDFLSINDDLKARGFSEKERAAELNMSINQLRSNISYANEERKQLLWDTIRTRIEDGATSTEISRALDVPESTVRKYAKMSNPKDNVKNQQLASIEEALKSQVADKKYLDVGAGVELQLGISKDKLNAVVKKLEQEGYYLHEVYVPQIAGQQGKFTILKTLTKEPDKATVNFNKAEIRPPETWSDNGGLDFNVLGPIKSLSGKSVDIVYAEDGGSHRDGLMEIRRGAKDLDLGASKYAQVRIAVDGTHYLKGMAMYSDDLPPGKDIRFYTNKTKDKSMQEVLKPMENEMNNPFGASIKRQQGALNIVNEEGDWGDWKSTFSSQFLSKQSYSLLKDRVNTTIESKQKALDEINKLTNPTVKKKLLQDMSEQLDSDANSLKLQGISNTKSHVILPFPGMRPDQVYAPNFKDGDRVVLLRHPHGGIFELPELTVNNRGIPRKILGNAKDAIGIHSSVAEKMSGADFDGDTVLVIPNNKGSIKTSNSLKELKNFDPHSEYPLPKGAKVIPKSTQQTQMGVVSNLITDMTLKGAPTSDIARAVRHSMVVIDAEKHKLDWKQSAIDNSIPALQRKYQAHVSKVEFDKFSGDMLPGNKKHTWGASTIVSRSSKDFKIFDPVTGKKKDVKKLMDLVDDAYKLSSGTKKEDEYARYANILKKMAIESKSKSDAIIEPKENRAAKEKYKEEVNSLNNKLNIAKSNAPKERQAQLLANKVYSEELKKREYTPDQKKKLRSQTLAAARIKVGAQKDYIKISDSEWEAIQNHAVSKTRLNEILNNADPTRVRELATPKVLPAISGAARAKAITLLGNGYTTAEIAKQLGLSPSTVSSLINK